MKVYECPAEVPLPEIDFKTYNHEKVLADEAEHQKKLREYLVAKGWNGPHTGKILAVPIADGYAQYMLADGPRRSALVHLPYGDAWHSQDVRFLPKTEVLRRIEARERLHDIFAKDREAPKRKRR